MGGRPQTPPPPQIQCLPDEVALLLEQDETGEYVGDKMVSVLVIEDGIIFDVLVTKDDE